MSINIDLKFLMIYKYNRYIFLFEKDVAIYKTLLYWVLLVLRVLSQLLPVQIIVKLKQIWNEILLRFKHCFILFHPETR